MLAIRIMIIVFYFLVSAKIINAQPLTTTPIRINNVKPISDSYFKIISNGGSVFFKAFPEGHAVELWVSDGTDQGTHMLSNTSDSNNNNTEYGLAVDYKNLVYFTHMKVSTYGREIWITDGTIPGTKMLTDLYPGPSNGVGTTLVSMGQHVYFFGAKGSGQGGLYSTDGTSSGTHMVASYPNIGTLFGAQILGVYNQNIYLSYTRSTGIELWKSDGTADGTVQVCNTGAYSDRVYIDTQMAMINNELFFVVRLPNVGTDQLWKTNGTPSGSMLVKSLSVHRMMPFKNKLYFFSSNFSQDVMSFYQSDGTGAGTVKIMDLPTFDSRTQTPFSAVIDDKLIFSSWTSVTNSGLWETDGTSGGTRKILNWKFGRTESEYLQLHHMNTWIFTGNETYSSGKIWRFSEPNNILLVADAIPNMLQTPNYLTQCGYKLFFTASDTSNMGAHGLWVLDMAFLRSASQKWNKYQ